MLVHTAKESLLPARGPVFYSLACPPSSHSLSLTRRCLCDGVGFTWACCCWSPLWLWLTVVVLVCVMMMPPGKRVATAGGVATRG